jgi:RimJ/RimL family protein N-acetyltransferase
MSSTDLALMELHMEAGFRHTPEGRLLETREVDPAPAPRFCLGRTRGGNLWRFRHDLPASLVRDLDALAAAEPVLEDLPREPVYLSQYRELLQEHEEIQDTGFGPAYCFPEELSPPPQVVRITGVNSPPLGEEFAWLGTYLACWEPALAAFIDEHAVSIGFTSRLTPRAAHAGVNTLEAFRGQGHASRVVAAWAITVREMGRVPLYNTSWDNLASQGVARRLGLRLYGVDFSLM